MGAIIAHRGVLLTQILISSLLLSGCAETIALPETGEEAVASPALTYSATLVREYEDIRNELGEVLAISFFEKPVLQGNNNEAINIINQYFEAEAKAFFGGEYRTECFPDNRFEKFREATSNFQKTYGDAVLVASPLEYTVTTEIMYMDAQTISIKETVYWMAGGVGKHHYFGINFDLSTGSIISAKNISDMTIDDFTAAVSTALCDFYSKNNIVFTSADIIAKNESNQFSDYNFYYDDINIYLIFPEDEYFNGSYIVSLSREPESHGDGSLEPVAGVGTQGAQQN